MRLCKPDTNPYFKDGGANDGTGTCVAEGGCDNTHFPVTTDKKCYPCSNTDKGGIADCQACSKTEEAVMCSACTALRPLLTRGAPEQKKPHSLLTDINWAPRGLQ